VSRDRPDGVADASNEPGVDPQSDGTLAEALYDSEATMPRFARWMYGAVRAELGRRVVDAGAGIGTFTDLLVADGRDVVALEYSESFVEHLAERFGEDPSVTVLRADLADPSGLPQFAQADSIICLNVLEHLENDVQALKNMRDRVRPGGLLVTLVPAYPWLFNSMDEAVGHFRRYPKGELESKLASTGWDVLQTYRFNSFGVPGWFFGGLMRRKAAGRTLFRLYDFLTPAFAAIERIAIRGLWGLSLVAVCRRAD
jgi:SAM-dependent methyltransferase